MRNLVLNLHLYGALIAGLFLIVLGVTGSILAFQEELDHLLNPQLFKIAPSSSPALPLSAIQESLHNGYPKINFSRLGLPQTLDQPYVAQFRTTQVFVNRFTGQIIGSRETPTLLESIRQLHTRLWLGQTGRNIVSAATFVSIFLVLSGLYLWWPVRHTGTARGLSFYLHYALGLYFSLFLLLLAITGLVITFDGMISPWIFKITASTQPKYQMPSTVVPGATPITATKALALASARLDGATPVSIAIPWNSQGSYAVSLKFPADFRESRVLVDQYSGAILSVVDSRVPPAGLRIMSDNGAIHTGTILGLPSKIVMSLSSLVLAVQTVTGYCLWWKKLRRKPQVP